MASSIPDLVEGVPDVQISVGVGRSVVQDVLLAGVVLHKLLVDTLLPPERLQFGLSLHGVRTLQKRVGGVEIGCKVGYSSTSIGFVPG